MDVLLISVTVVSLAVALVMSLVAWRATQGEKQRAAARVAALVAAAEIAPAEPSGQPEGFANSGRSAMAAFGTESSTGAPRVRPEPPKEQSPAGTVSVQAGFLGSTEEPPRESLRHQRWLMAGAAVLALVLGGLVAGRMSGGGHPAAAVQAAATTPLELLSLRHERQGSNLSVAGLVRNPPAAPVVERISAVVFLFDQQGQFVTSANAPIDFLKLTAGDESPFVVKVAAPQSVARYRVSFRTDAGTLPHVDRRGEPPVSAPVALTRQ